MEYVKLLIDKAAKKCGSDQALADRLGIARPNISLMRAGKRQISPATAAELADIAGEDARQAAIDAVIESAKGTRREGVLREILGKGLAVGVAGLLAISYSGESIPATEKIATNDGIAKHPIHRIYSFLYQVLRYIKRCMGDSASPTRLLPSGLSQPQAQKPPLTVVSARCGANCCVRTLWR